MEAKAEKTALAEQRVQKKAARRAAFIQEVAEAVYDYDKQKAREWSEQNPLWPKPTTPFGIAYEQYRKVEFAKQYAKEQADKARYEEARVLDWAKTQGLLPTTATELPSEEVQRYLLANLNDKVDASA